MADLRQAVGHTLHELRELFDGHCFIVANVKAPPDRIRVLRQLRQCLNGVIDMGKAPRLGTISIHREGMTKECLADKSWQYHTIATGLAWPHGIKKPGNDDRKLFLFPVRER